MYMREWFLFYVMREWCCGFFFCQQRFLDDLDKIKYQLQKWLLKDAPAAPPVRDARPPRKARKPRKSAPSVLIMFFIHIKTFRVTSWFIWSNLFVSKNVQVRPERVPRSPPRRRASVAARRFDRYHQFSRTNIHANNLYLIIYQTTFFPILYPLNLSTVRRLPPPSSPNLLD